MGETSGPPRRGVGRPTMHDVAAHAGVGLSTVSRVVSGKGGVKQSKVEAVERAIADLDYSRNEFAHTLRTGTAGVIGMLVPTIADPFYSTLIGVVEEFARKRDQLVLVASQTDDPAIAERILPRVLGRRLDGLIVVASEDAEQGVLERELHKGTPIVFIDRPFGDVDTDLVLVDNEGGAASAVTHLARHGHRRIACFAHTSGRFTSRQRQNGYRLALQGLGVADDPRLLAEVDEDVELCIEALRAMLQLDEPPTAIFSTNGRMTRTILATMRTLDVQLALVGFDDFELVAELSPPVTTVAQDPHWIGEVAAELLFDRIRGLDAPTRRIVLRTRLVPRGSGELPPLA